MAYQLTANAKVTSETTQVCAEPEVPWGKGGIDDWGWNALAAAPPVLTPAPQPLPRSRCPMSNLVRRSTSQVVPPDPLLNAQVMAAERVGIAAVARLQAGAFATSVAMQNACMLSRAANAAFKVSPMGEDIYQSILMAYGTLATTEIQALSMRDRGRS